MKKMIIIIVVLAGVLISMIIYKNMAVGSKNNVNIQEIKNIEENIEKIYLWKEVTNEALPTFDNINDADDLWCWEVVKKNIEKFEVSFEEIENTSKEIFGQDFNKQFPKEGNNTFEYNEENNKYISNEITLDQLEDNFIINDIKKTKEEYEVEIIEYLEDYSNDEKIIIRNLQNEEIGRVNSNESETKIHETVKENGSRFSKKRIHFKNEENKLIVEKVEKIQE